MGAVKHKRNQKSKQGGKTSEPWIQKNFELSEALTPLSNSAYRSLICYHHQHALLEDRNWSVACMVSASLGYVMILCAALILFCSGGQKVDLALVTGGIGVITKAISKLFFDRATKAESRATALCDHLREDQKFTVAVSLANRIPDPELRGWVQAQIALRIAQAIKAQSTEQS